MSIRNFAMPFTLLLFATTITLTVGQISFDVAPRDIIVTRGSPALFNCSISSTVSVSISWLKDGSVISPSSSKFTFLPNNSLLVSPTEAGDEGIYTCLVTDTASSLSSSQNATLSFAFILSSFLVEPDSQTVNEGTAVVHFFCIHGGSVPPATITWTLNGTTILPSERNNIASSVLLQTNPPQVTSTLAIARVQHATDMGMVRCVATNPLLPAAPVTSNTAIFRILVLPAPPTISTDPMNTIVLDGGTASLSCSASGEPSPTISWLLNGSPIILSSRVSVTRTGTTSELTVTSVTSSDTGSYSCSAVNSEGSATSNAASLQIASLGSSFALEPEDTAAVVGQNVILDCSAPPSIPPAVVSWTRNSAPLNNSRYQVQQNDSLLISSTILEDAGLYGCTASNGFLASSVSSQMATLSLLGVPLVTPSAVRLAVGETVTFTCDAPGAPAPDIAWLKGSNIIVNGINPRIMVNGSLLTIRDIVLEDSEYYTCRATLLTEVATARAILTVQGPPTFTSPVLNITGITSNSIDLPCSTLPDPEISYTWYFGRVPLSPASSGRNFLISDIGTLTISSVARSDEGTYTCMAVNSLGARNGTVFLEVYFSPNVTAASSTVAVPQGSTANLQCVSEGNPVPVQSWLSNGIPVSGPRFQVSGDGRTLAISDCRVEDEGNYMCQAVNSVGSSSAVVILDVQVPPSASASPTTLTLSSGTTSTFTCSVTGDPTPQVVWLTSNGEDISTLSDPRYQVTSSPDQGNNVTLTISDVQDSDHQQFTCRATNVISTATSTVTLNVLVSPVVTLPSETTGVQGRSLTIDCILSSGRPQPTVAWMRDGALIMPDSRVTVSSLGSLVFSQLFSTDASTYTCFASNSLGNSSSSTSLIVLVIPVIPVIRPNVTAIAGSSAVLDCTSIGNPAPTITWTMNSAPVISAGESRIQQAPNNSLLISEVLVSDEGSYLCQATNTAGTESATIELVVYELPVIQAQLPAVTAVSGSSISLRCSATGDPIPAQSWTRNGATISDSRFIIRSRGSELYVENVMESDEGQYRCVAVNLAGTSSATVGLNVISIPTVALPLTSVAVTEGVALVLECQTTGDPVPSVAWFFNSVQVPNSETSHISQAANNYLVFSSVRTTDRGQYVCQATNMAGQDSSSLQLTVYVVPTVSADQSSLTVVERTSAITLSCSVTGDPLPVLMWTRSGSPVTGSRSQISTDGRSLTISDVQVDDEGVYRCAGTNPGGSSSDTVSLNVIVPPEFVVLTNNTAIENQQHSMTCLAMGDPPPSITWTFDGQVVPSQQGLLTFTPVLRSNAGVYTCTASNSAGTISSQITLDVMYIPMIIQAPQDISVAAGSRVEFVCLADGNPIAQISWLFNNTAISGAQNSTYSIARVTASNAGQYACLSSNTIGIVSATATLTVFFPPSSPVLLSATASSSRVISLQWSRSSRDGGSPITGHVVEYRNVSDPASTFQPRPFSSTSLSADLDNLSPFTTYAVRVRADNAAGLSEPSNSLTTRTNPEAPSAPSNFRVTSFMATSVSLGWGMPEVLNGQFGAYQIRYGREDSFTSTTQETLLFTSTFTIVGIQEGVAYRMEVRASTRSLSGQTLWGPYAVLLVRDGVELELPTTPPTDTPTTMATTPAPSTQPLSTAPPSTQPPTSEFPTTEPSSTDPFTSQPPSTPLPTTESPSTQSPTTQTPSTSPPQTEPQTTEFLTTSVTTDAPSTSPETNPLPTVPLNPPAVVPNGLTAIILPDSPDEIHLYWREPMMKGSFTGYQVLVSPAPPPHIPTPILVDFSNVSSTYSLTGLPGTVTYNITVATYNSDGLGPLTEYVVVTTPENVPTAPRSLEVIRLGSSSSALVTWLPPAMPNGVLTQYLVRVYLGSPSGQLTETRMIPASPSTRTQAMLDNLDPDTTLYLVQVSAATSVGEGPVAQVMYGMDTSTPGTTPPAAPTSLPPGTVLFSMGTDPDSNVTASTISVERTTEEVIAGQDSTYYAIRIVPPVVGVLIIVAMVMGIIWCCVYAGRRNHDGSKTKLYEVANYQMKLEDIPHVEEQVDFAAEYDKSVMKKAFDSNVTFSPTEQPESFTESNEEEEDDDDGNSDQEVLLPFSSAVGRDAVQDMGDLDEFDQTQEKPTKLPSKKKPDQAPTPDWLQYQQVQGWDNTDFGQTPAYGMSSGGIMETRIGGNTGSETASGADYY